MKNYYCLIFVTLCCVFSLNAQLEGSWRISPEVGALKFGPEPGSDLWYINDPQTLIDRACFFEDTYVFNMDGSFHNLLGSETWIEEFQGASTLGQCDVPVFPHDGTADATYVYDDIAGTVTLNGQGAFLGLAVANNEGNLTDLTNVPQSITYDVVLLDNNSVMTLSIESGTGLFWTFKLIRVDLVNITDTNFENYLETHNANGDAVALGDASSMGDGVLNNLTLKSKVENVTELNVNDSNIASLQGIESFTDLEILFCQRNLLTSLDVSQNLALEELECETNQLSTLDVSQNTALRVLGCSDTNLSTIDVSNNLLLEAIWFTNNNIESLNLDSNTALRTYGLSNNPLVYMSIKNGNNANMLYIEAQNLPSLTCIEVDDENAAYLSESNWNVDPSISFGEDCGDLWTIYTSDINLDTALSSYGNTIDTSGDGEITLNEAAAYTGVLDLSNLGITDIQGLQGFTAVTEINLSSNNITDLSPLFGSSTVILINRQTQLRTVANSSFSALSVLDVSDNNLESIDLSELTTLVEFYCSNNALNSLNVKNGNNEILTSFDASNNSELSCIEVDNAIAASSGLNSYSSWIKDALAIYSEDCFSALSIDDNDGIPNISIFPNPVKDMLTINSKQPIDHVIIYSLLGQKVVSYKDLANNKIDISNFSKGLYILTAEINGAIQSIKFVKE